jgi:hypothetical protein
MKYILLIIPLMIASCSYTEPSISIEKNVLHNPNDSFYLMNCYSELDYYITLSWTLGTYDERNYRYATTNNWLQKY